MSSYLIIQGGYVYLSVCESKEGRDSEMVRNSTSGDQLSGLGLEGGCCGLAGLGVWPTGVPVGLLPLSGPLGIQSSPSSAP